MGKPCIQFSNVTISGTPISNVAQSWDTNSEYLYHLDIEITGVTNTMIIDNFVIPIDLLESIAPYADTNNDSITIYTKNDNAITSTLILLVVKEG